MGSQRQPFTQVLVETAIFSLPDTTDVLVPGSEIDTLRFGSKWISYNVAESNGNGATVTVQGSIDGTTWVGLQAQKTDGTAYSAAAVAVSGSGNAQIFITDDGVTNSPDVNGGYRYYRVVGHNTTSDTAHIAKVKVVGIVK